MKMEQTEGSLAANPEKFIESDTVNELSAKPIVYTREYLLSFANLRFCQAKPEGLDSTIWREAQAADVSGEVASIPGTFSRLAHRDGESDSSPKPFRDVPEWRRSSSLTQQSSRRKPYNDETSGSPFSNNYAPKQAFYRGDSSESRSNHDKQATQAPKFMEGHERWGHRGEREKERGRFNFNRDNNVSGQKSGEHDGLLGSGESSRGTFSSGVVGLSPSSKAIGKYVAGRGGPTNTSTDTFRVSKGTYGPRHSTDAINDETFGEEQYSEERSEQERKRRESFELMRQESKKSVHEQQSFELEKPEEQQTSKIDRIVDKTHTEDTWDDTRDLRCMPSSSSSSKSLIHEPSISGSVMKASEIAVPSVVRPLVPPGFSEIMPKTNEHNSCDEEKHPEKTEGIKEDERSILKDDKIDSKCTIAVTSSQSSFGHETKGKAGLMIDITSSDELLEESQSVLTTSTDKKVTEADSVGVGEMRGSFFLSESQADPAGDFGAKMSKFAKWFPFPGAEDKQKHATPVVNSASHFLSLLSGSGNSDSNTIEGSFEPFKEVNDLKEEKSSSSLLVPLKNPVQVLPMPFGPSLEDIEKDMTVVANAKGEDPFSPGSPSKNKNKAFPVYRGEQEVALPASVLKTSKVFLTCEDIEQSLLAEAEGHQGQTLLPSEISQNAISTLQIKESEVPNFTASQHLLSLLQRSSADSTSRGNDVPEQHFVPREEMPKNFFDNEPSAAATQISRPKDESASETTLKSLFGKAFMKELRSHEAPVSVQSFPYETKSEHGLTSMDLAESEQTSLPHDPFHHSLDLQALPPKSTHRYYDKKGEGSSVPTSPVEHYGMPDERGKHPIGYASSSEWPQTEDPALLLGMLAAGPPSKNGLASVRVPASANSSVERLERNILERKASGGSKKLLANAMSDMEEQMRLNAAFDKMSNTYMDQPSLEDLLIGKDMEGDFPGQLNFRDQLFGHPNLAPLAPPMSGTRVTSRGKVPEALFLDNAVLESVLDEVCNTGKHSNMQREMGAFGEFFNQLDTASTNAVPSKKANWFDEKSLALQRDIDAFQRASSEDPYQSVPFDSRRVSRAELVPKNTSTEFENKLMLEFFASASASGSLNPRRVPSSQQHSHSGLASNSLYRSHSPVISLSDGTNISLGNLQQALVSNNSDAALHPSAGQVGRQHFHSQPEPLFHHMITGNKISGGSRNQQHSVAARTTSNSYVANRSHVHGYHDVFMNPNNVPQAVFPPPLPGSVFPPGQFPHRFGPSFNARSDIHEQFPYDSHGFGMPITGYSPSNGPIHPLMAHLNSPFHNIDLQRSLQMEQPVPGLGHPNIARDFNSRFPRLPPHWN